MTDCVQTHPYIIYKHWEDWRRFRAVSVSSGESKVSMHVPLGHLDILVVPLVRRLQAGSPAVTVFHQGQRYHFYG